MADIKQMPGYEQQKQADVAVRRQKEMEARNARIKQEQLEVEEEMRRINEKAAKMKRAKKDIIRKELQEPDYYKTYKSRLAAYAKGLRTAVKVQLISFAIGSGMYGLSATVNENDIENAKDAYTAVGAALVKAPYHDTNSYKQAVKNAYLFEGFSAEQGNAGTFQSICGLIAMLITLARAAKSIKRGIEEIEDKNIQRTNYNRRQKEKHEELVDYVYRNLEALTEYKFIEANDVIFGRNHQNPEEEHFAPGYREMFDVLQKYAMTLVPKMAEIDQHYFNNLLNGGLENVNWDVANAIVSGHLKSHPEDYNEIIKIIDESTMEPELVKKYGRGKVVSWGAAQAMMRTGKNDR